MAAAGTPKLLKCTVILSIQALMHFDTCFEVFVVFSSGQEFLRLAYEVFFEVFVMPYGCSACRQSYLLLCARPFVKRVWLLASASNNHSHRPLFLFGTSVIGIQYSLLPVEGGAILAT